MRAYEKYLPEHFHIDPIYLCAFMYVARALTCIFNKEQTMPQVDLSLHKAYAHTHTYTLTHKLPREPYSIEYFGMVICT